MHIADGILPAPACVAAHAAALCYASAVCRKIGPREAPRMGLTAALIFVCSSIHFPLGATSMHLGLFGLAGVLLGPRAFVVVYAALLLQTVLLQHGGLLTLGVNALNMGAGATLGWLCWRLPAVPQTWRGFLAGFVGIEAPALLMAVEFAMSGYGKGFFVIAGLYSLLALAEGAGTSAAVSFLDRVHPGLLYRPERRASEIHAGEPAGAAKGCR